VGVKPKAVTYARFILAKPAVGSHSIVTTTLPNCSPLQPVEGVVHLVEREAAIDHR
jgi:hypothetical protein